MADILGIGVSGLAATQVALDTAGHNIANVNNPNYSRQSVALGTRVPDQAGNGFFGTGVQVNDVRRAYDQFALEELRINLSLEGRQETLLTAASRLNNLFGDSETGLSTVIEQFYAATQQLSQDPTSVPAREVMLQKADIMVKRFAAVYEDMRKQSSLINGEITASVDRINNLANNLAELNSRIVASGSRDGTQQPNDLLDQRDELLNELSKEVSVSVVNMSDGSMNVFIGNGQILVLGSRTQQLSTIPNATDPNRREVAITTLSGAQVNISNNISGGKLGGVLDYRRDILDRAFDTVGRVATGIAFEFNEQHAQGMDLDGDLGGLFFGDINSSGLVGQRIQGASTNPVTPIALELHITDPAALKDGGYNLSFNAGTGNWDLLRGTDNSTVMSFADPGVAPAVIDVPSEGFALHFTGVGAVGGERYALNPVRFGAREISLAISSAADIAGASPLAVARGATNIGNGLISASVTDITDPSFTTTAGALTPPLSIRFNSATDFDVIDASTNLVLAAGVPFTPNQNNDVLALAGLSFGYQVTLKGQPVSGDTFSVGYNTNGTGDNSNLLQLASQQTRKLMDGGNTNFQEAYGRMVAFIGTRTQEAQTNLATATALREQAQARRDELSGVNLDEEAASLIRYQNAYQASARVIATAKEVFDILFRAVGG